MKRQPPASKLPVEDGAADIAALRESLSQAEAARVASETRLRLILESARDFAIITMDIEGVITSWSPGARAIFGYEEAQVLGQPSRLLFTPEDQAADRPETELRIAAEQGRCSDDRWLRRRDGSRFFANGLTMPLREHARQNALTGFLKILRDCTEQRKAEEARHQAEARFRILAESVQDYAIFLLDPEGVVITWSKGAERVKGYSEAEALGASFRIFYPPEDRESGEPERELAIAAAEGRFEKEGCWRTRKDGTGYWASETIVRLADDNHNLLGFAQICRDLSERRHAEEDRARLLEAEQAARQAAEAANAAKDHFLAALSHELRTPLSPIAMAAYTLGREKTLSANGRLAVEMIQRNLQTESRLIDDLLDVSRSLHGKLDLDLVPIDAHECVRGALEVVQPDIDAKGLKLTVSLRAGRSQVCADAGRLQQVFWNLLSNAVKFTPAGGWIEVRSRNASPGKVLIEVTDSGIGIEAEALPRIFDPFEQGNSGGAKQLKGLGLGLAIAQNIMQAHDGRLSAQSGGAGLGSAFQVELSTIRKSGKKVSASKSAGDE